MKTYYLDCWIGKDGSVVFSIEDYETMVLYRKQILVTYEFVGKRATVICWDGCECLLRWAALDAAKRFMSGDYRTFNLKTMEWENGVEH